MNIGARHDAECCCEACVCEKEARDSEIGKVVKAARQLVDGSPVPDDNSHTELKANGQQRDYVVLSPEERAKGFVKPLRKSYVHTGQNPKMHGGRVLLKPDVGACGGSTRMGLSIAETYAREPAFYSGTFCVNCNQHFKLTEFRWEDGEPMHVPDQVAWAEGQIREHNERRQARILVLRAELAELEAQTAA